MTTQFIGAGPGSARRRRRLILSGDAGQGLSGSPLSQFAQAVVSGLPSVTAVPRLVYLIRRVIRPQLWVTWVLVALALLVWGAVVIGGATLDQGNSPLKDLFGLKAGRATQLLTNAALLMVTQLSLITLFLRMQSRKDFHGRYRIWIWTSAIWMLLLIGFLSRLQNVVTGRAAELLPPEATALAPLAWFIPVAILFGGAVKLMGRDLSHRLAERWLLRLASLVAVSGLVIRLVASITSGQLPVALLNAMMCLWPVLMASALLHHARYVVHITNEVTDLPKRRSWLRVVRKQVGAELMAMVPTTESLVRLVQLLRQQLSRRKRTSP